MYSSLPTKRVCCGLGEDGADKARVRAGAWVRAGATTRIARRAHTRWHFVILLDVGVWV
jgi:hypothetical protein